MNRLNEPQTQILNLLRRRGAMTVEELSRALGVSGNAVRHHLDRLLGQQLLAAQPEHRPLGRPRHLFHLTDAAEDFFPKQYAPLSEMLLEYLESLNGPEGVDLFFAQRRARTEAELWPRLEPLSLEERVALLAEAQDRAGYMAEWEKAEGGVLYLRQSNCAICKVARTYRQACAHELKMLQNLTRAEVVRETHIASGDFACIYRIQPLPSP